MISNNNATFIRKLQALVNTCLPGSSEDSGKIKFRTKNFAGVAQIHVDILMSRESISGSD